MSNLNFFRVMQASNFDAQSIPCNAGDVSFSGGAGYYVATAVVLGDSIGPVTASFNSQGIPDRFQLRWGGKIVADSLFVGDSLDNSLSTYNSYTSSIGNVSNLTQYNYDYSTNSWSTGSAVSVSYTSASFPPYSANGGAYRRNNGDTAVGNSGAQYVLTSTNNGFKPLTGSLEQGNWGGQYGVNSDYPNLSGGANALDGDVQLKFFKHTKFPTTFDIIVHGPSTGTAWSLSSISCPTENAAHSSSIYTASFSSGLKTIYHQCPTYDLRPGMFCYYDEQLTQPFSSSLSFNLIVSASLPTNPPSSGDVSNFDYGFQNTDLADSGTQAFLTFYDGNDANLKGMIMTCSAAPAY